MDIAKLLRRHLVELRPYEAVDPPESLAEAAGVPPDKIIKLNGNENPYGPSLRVQEALGRYRSYHIYPDARQKALLNALEEYTSIPSDYIVAGAGADELIDLLLRAVLERRERVIDCPPTFGMYAFSTHVNSGTLVSIPRDSDFNLDIPEISRAITRNTKVIFIASPNNPTGNLTSQDEIIELLEKNILVVVDETYFEFSGQTVAPLIYTHRNLVVLRSMSKWAGLAGLRLGYGIMDPFLQRQLMEIKPPYNVNAAAEVAFLASLRDLPHLRHNIDALVQERERLFSRLSLINRLHPWPSQGNFLLCDVPPGKGPLVYNGLVKRGIFVRYFDTPRLRDSIRISVGKPQHTDALANALEDIIRGL